MRAIPILIAAAVVTLPLPAVARAQVGGSVTGLAANAVTCRNLTTGQSVSMPTSDESWDCEAMGLLVSPGDVVITGARGVVPEQPPMTCSHPVEESAIDAPGNTGWPNHLANIITMNVDGTVTKIGVDRWDKEGLTWTVSLWDIGCGLLASASVSGGTGWYFADIAPVAVAAGQRLYVGYEVSGEAGSYLYRDTTSPVNVGAYTVDFANYNVPGACPTMPNGAVVSPVDIEVCTSGARPAAAPDCRRGAGLLGATRVATDEVP